MTDTTDHPSRRAGLRDELRRAVCEAEGFVWDSDMLEPDEYGDLADAIMPVLYREWPWLRAEAEDAVSAVVPAADRAALRDRIAAAIWERQNPGRRWADCEHPWGADAEDDADAVLSVLPAPADRAAEELAAVRPQTLTALAAHVDARAVAILRPDSETYAEWQTVAGVFRRLAAVPVVGVAADTTPDETQSAAVFLSTPCDACRHTLNWHRNDVGCTVALCVCGRFQQPVDAVPGPLVPAQPGNDTNTRIVAYRSRDGRALYCTRHTGEIFGFGWRPVDSDDLPDGGICTHPDCGADVVIPQQPKEA